MSAGRRFIETEIVHRQQVARDTYLISFAVELSRPVHAGQFAMIHSGDDERYILPRPYSVLDSENGRLDLLVKIAGRGSRELAEAPVGTGLRVLVPLGTGFDVKTFDDKPVILVAGGVGIVPLHKLARELKATGVGAPFSIFGARSPADLPMDLLGREPAGPWQLWVERDARDSLHEGRVTQGLAEALDRAPHSVVATCGPTPMMHAVARICRERSVALWVCLEEQMGCGAGVCRACVVEDAHEPRMRTVCKEGPVFRVDEIHFLPEDRESDRSVAGCTT